MKAKSEYLDANHLKLNQVCVSLSERKERYYFVNKYVQMLKIFLFMNTISSKIEVKGALLKIWNPPYMFVLIWKQYPEHFAFFMLRILSNLQVKFVNFLKRTLIVNIFCYFSVFVNKHSTYLKCTYHKK